MKDLFDKIYKDKGPLGKWAEQAEGYFVFPKLEGPISNRMKFRGKDVITWSINDYLGLANHPETRKVDAEAAKKWGSAYPMGARMMSGHTDLHEQLQRELAAFVKKEAAYLLNFGYQGMVSTIDALVAKDDVIVYDVDAHACIIDGVRLHLGQRFTYKHNDMESIVEIFLELVLEIEDAIPESDDDDSTQGLLAQSGFQMDCYPPNPGVALSTGEMIAAVLHGQFSYKDPYAHQFHPEVVPPPPKA